MQLHLLMLFSIFDGLVNIIQVSFRFFKLILCGDFNVDLLKNSKEKDEFIDLLTTFNLKQT